MQNGERVADTWRVSECGRIATYRGKRPPSAAPGFREQVMAVFGKPENGLWYLGERAVLWAPTNPISHCFGDGAYPMAHQLAFVFWIYLDSSLHHTTYLIISIFLFK